MASVKVKLAQPIAFGEQMISEIVIREPKAKDLRKLSGTPNVGELLDLAGKLSGQPQPVIDDLSVKDMHKVLEVVGDFFGAGQ